MAFSDTNITFKRIVFVLSFSFNILWPISANNSAKLMCRKNKKWIFKNSFNGLKEIIINPNQSGNHYRVEKTVVIWSPTGNKKTSKIYMTVLEWSQIEILFVNGGFSLLIYLCVIIVLSNHPTNDTIIYAVRLEPSISYNTCKCT